MEYHFPETKLIFRVRLFHVCNVGSSVHCWMLWSVPACTSRDTLYLILLVESNTFPFIIISVVSPWWCQRVPDVKLTNTALKWLLKNAVKTHTSAIQVWGSMSSRTHWQMINWQYHLRHQCRTPRRSHFVYSPRVCGIRRYRLWDKVYPLFWPRGETVSSLYVREWKNRAWN